MSAKSVQDSSIPRKPLRIAPQSSKATEEANRPIVDPQGILEELERRHAISKVRDRLLLLEFTSLKMESEKIKPVGLLRGLSYAIGDVVDNVNKLS